MSCLTKRLIQLAMCMAVCGLATLASGQPQQQKEPGKKTGNRIEKRTYEFKDADNKTMEYALFVHSKYAKDQKTPLMVALHGLGGNPQQIMRSKGLTDLAEKHGYIVVAPMGYNSGGWYGAKIPGGLGKGKGKGDTPANLSELSEKDVMNVLEIVRKEFTIDEKRVYLMGHSMGGGGTWYLGLKYPEMWAGLAPIAPAIFTEPKDLDKIKKIPVIVVQGDKDNLVPAAGTRKWVAKMKDLEMNYQYLEIEGGDHINVVGTGMPKIFEFFEKQLKKEDNGK
jgi:predicted peptidase